MIDDPELRALFKAESEEHLQTLETGLLHLESEPHDSAALEELFRSAHSLKGAAGMLGIESVETLAHHFEDQLGAARRGQLIMSSPLADRLYQGLDAMRRLAQEASGGEPARIDLASVLAELRSANSQPESEPATSALPEDDSSAAVHADTVIPEYEAPETPDDLQTPVSPAAFTIDTIRVVPQKLDALMTLAGELAVTTTRVARALAAIDDLTTLSEEWTRDASALRSAGTVLAGESGGEAERDCGKQIARLHEREVARLERLSTLTGSLQRMRQEEVARLGLVTRELDESIRNMRLLPFSTLFSLFPRLVRDLSQEQQKEVHLVVEGGTVTADKHLLEEMKDPLMHIIRNAIDHGIERPDERERQGKPRTATLLLRASQAGARVALEITDDGQGLDEDAIRRSAVEKRIRPAEEIAALTTAEARMLIFAPGFSTSQFVTDLSGRGVGLDVVRTNIERLKGTITVESARGRGCTFRLQAPMTLATTRVLLVQAAHRSCGIPLEAVQEIIAVSPQAVFPLEGRPSIRHDGQPIPAVHLADLLELSSERLVKRGEGAIPEPGSEDRTLPCILIDVGGARLGLFVDVLQDQQEVILKPFGGLLQRVRNVFGAAVLSSGEICMVLNPPDLIRSAQKMRARPGDAAAGVQEERRKVVLLAEDSITIRTQEKRILESAGYEVVTAADGADAFSKLGTRSFDAVVSDVEMPNMDGLMLAARIRQNPKYKELPIILVTSLASDSDRRRGVEVGANAYITKGAFDQTVLLNTLRRLV